MQGDGHDPSGESATPTGGCEDARRADRIEREQLEYALDRLENAGDVTDRQRAIVADLAAAITSALGPAAIEVERAARATEDDGGDSSRSRATAEPETAERERTERQNAAPCRPDGGVEEAE